jgi:hypothetical protein
MTKAEAEGVLSAILRSINSGPAHAGKAVYTFEEFINEVYLPFARRGWPRHLVAVLWALVFVEMRSAFAGL